jgi:serine phosphatase RsbU (regulator of sigma subunit)
MNDKRQVFGENRILEFLGNNSAYSAEKILELLNQEMLLYSSSHQFDDATAVIVKIID